jgi:hypothetical protein
MTTEPVIMEVLAGARTDAQAGQLRRLLLRATSTSTGCRESWAKTWTTRPCAGDGSDQLSRRGAHAVT